MLSLCIICYFMHLAVIACVPTQVLAGGRGKGYFKGGLKGGVKLVFK